ncbi:MAG: heme NO-binding domain-containing protein [Albidovulum sp.]
MHGLVNRSFQNFLRDTYGSTVWDSVASVAELPPQGFEALLTYDDRLTEAMIGAASLRLGKPRDALLEDFGIYLAGREGLRRLLRFGGADFIDFLYSLEELPGRARLAVPDLILAEMTLSHAPPGRFLISFHDGHPSLGHVMCGILQAMADDFGALALITATGEAQSVQIDLIEASYAVPRDFALSLPEMS